MDVLPLDRLPEEVRNAIPPIEGIGGILVQPTGFVIMRVQVPCIIGYDEDQMAIILDDPGMKECPVILGMPTLYQVMEVIKESEIADLTIPWASSRVLWLLGRAQACMGWATRDDVANKPICPTAVDEVIKVSHKFCLPHFGHKVIHGQTKLILTGCKLNVMMHGLETRLPQLPLGVNILCTYSTLTTGSGHIAVVLRNNTDSWLEVDKAVSIARMVSANHMPLVDHDAATCKPQVTLPTLTEPERWALLMQKLDLSGLKTWPPEEAAQACSLLKEYHNLFSLKKHEIGHTNLVKHKIVLQDPDTLPFKERFWRILPPQVDEVREHLKLMLDAGAICPSNSPWCNAVVLVRKKDGSFRFCINFRRLNSLTKKDSHPLPRICETLDSLVGSTYYSTFDLTSGFWQVPMDEESKQFTAFTLGSMGLFECEGMSFGLCSAPITFQRLMQNCLDELNLTYCLIYLDDVIVYSKMPAEHLQRMWVVFDCLRMHDLKLKSSKCDLFKTEINYLAHHVSKAGVLPSKKNLV